MKRIAGTGALVAMVLGVYLPGVATAATTGVGLGVHGGYGQSKDADSGSPLAGAHLVLNVAPWLGVVGMIDYKFEEDFSDGNDDVTVTSLPISAMGRIYIPVSSFSPYVAAGVQYRLLNYGGNVFDDDQFDIDDSDSAFGWLAGAGAEFGLGDTTGFFGEVRYESIDPDKDFDNAVDDAEELSFDQWSARVGLTFFLK
jgi:opacity protein-like surface antigen